MASIELSYSTDTTLTVYLSGLQESYTGNKRTCRWYADGVSKGSMILANEIYDSQDFTIRNLKGGTSYAIRADITASGWTSTVTVGPTNFKTDKPAIEEFYWSTKALNAFNSQGLASSLTADEWNELVFKLEEIFSGWSGSSAYANSGDVITAAKFNVVARKAGYSTVAKGDPLDGYLFIGLADAVNSNI